MARVTVMPPFADEFLGGTREFAIEAGTLFALVRALDRIGPGFAEEVEGRGAVAVDGAVVTDWSTPLGESADVLIIPRVAGG